VLDQRDPRLRWGTFLVGLLGELAHFDESRRQSDPERFGAGILLTTAAVFIVIVGHRGPSVVPFTWLWLPHSASLTLTIGRRA
jgi:hypothetical protein